jgi:hypothetical protein
VGARNIGTYVFHKLSLKGSIIKEKKRVALVKRGEGYLLFILNPFVLSELYPRSNNDPLKQYQIQQKVLQKRQKFSQWQGEIWYYQCSLPFKPHGLERRHPLGTV